MPSASDDVLILGAGPAGLMCAIGAARRGRRVRVLDHNADPGAKLLVTGGGRCNCTNLDVAPSHYVSENPRFCASALARFTPQQFLEMLAAHGLTWQVENIGEVFCDQGAGAVRAMLVADARVAGVTITPACEIVSAKHGACFEVETRAGLFSAEALVIATGGLAWPRVGASGIGYELARQFGLRVTPTRPGLVPFVLPASDAAWTALAGIALDVSLTCGTHTFRGNMLFTHRGLSGPVALRASLHWQPEVPLVVDFLPDERLDELLRTARLAQAAGAACVRTLLQRLPKRVVACLLEERLLATHPAQCTRQDIAAIIAAVHRRAFVPASTEGYATAEVTIGGVDTRDLSSKTMAARAVPGLYCIGEVVDVTGQLGGYNLHWAWASGSAAGEDV